MMYSVAPKAYAGTRSGKSSPSLVSSAIPVLIAYFFTRLDGDNCIIMCVQGHMDESAKMEGEDIVNHSLSQWSFYYHQRSATLPCIETLVNRDSP